MTKPTEIDHLGRPRVWVKAKVIVNSMAAWFDANKKRKPPRDGRTEAEVIFDSGVFAASELVRRLTDDEELALAVHEACIWRQREHAKQQKEST